MAKMEAFRSLSSRRFYSSMSSALCSENGCYEHIPLVKSGEGKQCIQLKRMLIKGLVPTPNTIVQHFFSAGISQANNGELLICCLFHALEMYLYSLSLHTTKFALFLSYKNRTNCGFSVLNLRFSYHIKIEPIVVSILFK